MAASVRGGLVVLPLPPLLRLAPSPRRRRRRAPGVRAASEGGGAPRPPEPVEVVGVGSRKDAVIDFCLGSRTLSSTPIRFCVPGLRTASQGGGALRPPKPVEVVGVGIWKDAVIDFCLGSQTLSSTLIRFWTVHADNSEVQFIQRTHDAETVVRDLEPPSSLHPCPPAVIIVASAGQEADQIAALELLSATKSADNLAASIFLKPFCFEGQRRQVEASDLIVKLQACSNFHIVIEADSLLETEVETLAEALESANNAVLSTISMISIMMSGFNQMFWSSLDAQVREVGPDAVGKLLKSYGEARVGFGAGYNIQSAIKQAVLHCPFLRGGIKELNSVVFLSLTTSRVLSESDMISTLHIFRRVTGFTEDIIFSRNSEPDLEPKLIVVSLLTIRNSCDENVPLVKDGFLSSLASRFPFISSLMGGDTPELKQAWSNHSFKQPPDSGLSLTEQRLSKRSSASADAPASNLSSEEIENIKPQREYNNNIGRTQPEFQEAKFESDRETTIDVGREDLSSQQERNFWSRSPAFGIAQLWAKERATTDRSNQSNELNVITLPVGVKSPEAQYDHSPNTQPETRNATDSISLATRHAASGASFSDVGLEKVMDICNSAASFLKGRMDKSRKRGSVASRAASMLDAEREPEKTWSPIVEIQFGEGTYRGRCQEGVPEGKGRLTYSDGSFYDGLWRYGKRSGLGTLYYSNGDVFHGTWRDGLIHGKGWYYFHSGDRWFANFWKGKANGEGRFYAKDGSILFGHFRNGWHHGECLLIDENGSRWLEVWDDGLLIGRTKLEK